MSWLIRIKLQQKLSINFVYFVKPETQPKYMQVAYKNTTIYCYSFVSLVTFPSITWHSKFLLIFPFSSISHYYASLQLCLVIIQGTQSRHSTPVTKTHMITVSECHTHKKWQKILQVSAMTPSKSIAYPLFTLSRYMAPKARGNDLNDAKIICTMAEKQAFKPSCIFSIHE